MNRFLVAFCATLMAAGVATATDYDESVDGDISGDPTMPTAFPLTVGDNSLSATSVGGDLEYFTATIPAGHELSSIFLDAYSNSFGVSFIAVQAGTSFTEPPDGTMEGNLLGYHLFGAEDINLDILDDIGTGLGSMGFSPPLPAGDFTFWSQDTGGTVSYTYRFEVTAVPEPGTATAILGMLLAATGFRRR